MENIQEKETNPKSQGSYSIAFLPTGVTCICTKCGDVLNYDEEELIKHEAICLAAHEDD